jgi:DNA-binding transcriptional MerR regulator
MVGPQVRYRVTDIPTERTLRYYIARGIVDTPLGKRGTASLYGYRHLLQVLAVKYLQSQYLPLKKIGALLREKSNRGLEQLLPGSRSERVAVEEILSGPGSGRQPEERPRTRGDAGGERWRRVKVRAGLELHFREDLAPPGEPGELQKWREDLLRPLEKLWLQGEKDPD